MKNQPKNNENIGKYEDEIGAEQADKNAAAKPADDGFKSSDKSNGLTWEGPSDEQALDSVDLSKDNPEEEED